MLLDDFKSRFPEFGAAVADQYIPILESVWPSYYGRTYAENPEIVLQLVAHLLVGETQTSKSAAQVVASKSVGSVSTRFVAASHSGGANFDFFQNTKYGQRFWMMTKNKHGAVAV